jgi:glycogen(starch) synthase
MKPRTAEGIRVLHVTPEFPPVIWGGLGTAVGGLVNASAQAGMRVGVLLVGGTLVRGERGYGGWRPATEEVVADGRLQVLADSTGVTFFHVSPDDAVEASLRFIPEWQPDVIHLHSAWLWPVARAIREKTHTPLVFTVHSLDRVEYEIGGIGSRWEIQETVIRRANRVIALSRSEKDLLAQHCPEVCDRVRIVGNGIDDYGRASEAARKDRHNEPLLVLYVGRFVDRKGIRELLGVIPLVLKEAPETHFVLIGGYGGGAEIERTWLIDALQPYRNQVHFTGWLAPHEVANWYRLADILVVPSWYEPFGMVILEGMLYGLPIAASDVGGPAEILEHGRTGLLFPPKNVEAFSRTLLRLLKDEDLRRQIGAGAAAEVRRQWLWPRIVQKMGAVYQETTSVWPSRKTQNCFS